MSGFVKLFNSILHSTIWSEPDHVRLVWITMLAMSNRYGDVEASVPGLARMAGKSIDETEDAIQRFLSPDPYSRSPENEGRRIQTIVGGWHLLNHGKYRELLSAEERKEYNRRKQAERRARIAAEVNDKKLHVNDNQQCQHIQIAEADTKADTEAKKNNNHIPTSPEAIRISTLYRRRKTTPWSAKEIRAFKSLLPIVAEDLDLVCRYEESEMAKGDKGKHRRDLATFLNNYQGEVDRAREWESNKSSPQGEFLIKNFKL